MMLKERRHGTKGMGLITRWVLKAIGFYQKSISPASGRRCRFLPTCSEYAMSAIERFGPARGTAMAARRLLRCQPFGSQGYDPVPPAKREGRLC